MTSDVSLDPVATGTFVVTKDTLRRGLVLDIESARNKAQELQHKVNGKRPVDFWLNLRGSLKNKETWAEMGHVLVTQQFKIVIEGLNSAPEIKRSLGEGSLEVENGVSAISVTKRNGKSLLTIDKKTGTIKSMTTTDGTSLLARQGDVEDAGVNPNYTRAATDNDRGGIELILGFVLPDKLKFLNPIIFRLYGTFKGYSELSYSWFWSVKGMMPDSPPVVKCTDISVSETANKVQIDASCSIRINGGSRELIKQTFKYTVFADGQVKVETKVQPNACLKNLPSLARVGLEATLDKSLFNMTYYGRGEVENYPDRKTGTEVGIWKTTVEDNEFDYIVPSENGNKTDCRFVAFQDTKGRGVCFVADPDGKSINIGATLNSQADLHSALHTCDVGGKKNGEVPIYAHIDHRIMGVGGDVSWFPAVYPDYVVKADEEFNYTVWLLPLSEGDDPYLLAKNIQ